MSEPVDLAIEYPGGNTDKLLVSIAEGDGDTRSTTGPAKHMFRLEETPIFGDPGVELHIGDTIEAEPLADGTHRFVRVVKRAELRHCRYMLSQKFAGSPHCAEYLAAVVAAGATWELIMGGILLVHIPFSVEFDDEAELDRCIRAAGNGAAHV